MPNPKLTPEKLRAHLAMDFTAEELAQLFRLPVAVVETQIAALDAPDPKVQRLLAIEAERTERLWKAQAAARKRPQPPEDLFHMEAQLFLPAPDVRDWMVATFIDSMGELSNDTHEHLALADIGVLWTPVQNKRKGQIVLGQAEKPFPKGDPWAKARALYQLQQWFGVVPDFVLTFDARYAQECDDWSWCALCEHELLHCGQMLDRDGCPAINEDTGRPKFCLVGHDVEQFVDVVYRYGSKAAGVQAMIDAAARGPYFAEADIQGACGTCLR